MGVKSETAHVRVSLCSRSRLPDYCPCRPGGRIHECARLRICAPFFPIAQAECIPAHRPGAQTCAILRLRAPLRRVAMSRCPSALAINEKRKPLRTEHLTRPPNWQEQLVQARFAGVHSNVGGGYTPDGLANVALP